MSAPVDSPKREMRAFVLHEWGGELVAESRPVPVPGPGDVRVRVVACGAGLTLAYLRAGAFGGTTPRIMGHEFGGVIDAVGAGVRDWRLGDRVTASFNLFCGHCRWCASGRETLCERHGGFIGGAIDGAFADYVVVPARNLVPVPAGLDLRLAGLVADAVATAYHAARERARLVPGQRVAVIGAGGGVGVHMLEVARAFGAEVVAVERDDSKLRRLRDLGVGAVVSATDDLTGEALIEAAGAELDAVFDLVCSPVTFRAGCSSLGRGGTLVILGTGQGELGGVDPVDVIVKEKTITGSRNVTRAEIRQTLELVADGRVPLHVGASYPLDRIGEAFEAIEANAVFGRIVIDVSGE